MKTQNGFTLIELMITIAVAAVLLTIALPNMRDYIAAARVSSTSNDLVFMLALGKSEAIKRRATIELKPVQANDWSQGLKLMVPAKSGVAEQLIKVSPAVNDSGISIKNPNNVTKYSFNPYGLPPSGAAAATFVVCAKGLDISRQRKLVLGLSGRPAVSAPTDKNDCK